MINSISQWETLQAIAPHRFSVSMIPRHVKHNGIYFDFSRQFLDDSYLYALIGMAQSAQLQQHIQDLFSGKIVNLSEKQPALHMAYRRGNARLFDRTINNTITAHIDKMRSLVSTIINGKWLGYTGKPIRHVVNIGVGGSDLGAVMTQSALVLHKTTHLNIHFVSSMDGMQLVELLPTLDAETTLFIVASKSFSTADTLGNANHAKSWLKSFTNDDERSIEKHFIGISSNSKKMTDWGIPEAQQLPLSNYVGGRYSIWSTMGLPLALYIGMPNFEQFLAGGHDIDQHFLRTPFNENIPVLHALVALWNRNFCNITSHCLLPYDSRLHALPDYLAQLIMESNGKSATQKGECIQEASAPVVWGEVGTNAQHAFFQMLHQGSERVWCEFILTATGSDNPVQQQQHKMSNCNAIAQSQLLYKGSYCSQLEHHYPGRQCSTTFILPKLDPFHLGQLIAIYEHSVYCQSVIWGINCFDQWGVEQGKKLALSMQGNSTAKLDEVSQLLLDHLSKYKV